MTHYRIIDDMHASGDELQELIKRLPEWRQEEALRFKFEGGRRECAMAYLLLCDMLREHWGITEQPRFAIGEHGKPSLVFGNASPVFGNASPVFGNTSPVFGNTSPVFGNTSPVFGNTLPNTYFNLSHCKRAIACIVSDEGEVGIDVECTGRYKPSLAEYCMSEAEVQAINDAADTDLEFTRLWTRKEALLKLTGEGITDDMKDVLTSRRMENVTLETIENKEKGYVCTLAHYGRGQIAS